VLEAKAANAAGVVSAAWMGVAHLRSSGPMPPADQPFEECAAHLLGVAEGSISSRHFAEGSSAAHALAGLRDPGVSDYLAAGLGMALQRLPLETVAQLWPSLSADSGIPPTDAAAAHAAQAASRQEQRDALLPQQPDGLQPAGVALAPSVAPPAQLNTEQQHQQQPTTQPDAAAFLAHYTTLLAALPSTAGGAPVFAGLQAPAAAVSHARVTNQGGAGIAKKCSLCQLPRKGTHGKGCPTYCKDCKQLHAACSCRA
jgi:hypothetical protein